MRDLILKRIDEIRVKESNFPEGTMKWKDLRVYILNQCYHISKTNSADLNCMSDEELVFLFEIIIRKLNQQY